MLAFGLGDFFLAGVADELLDKLRVWDKAWADFMVMFPLLPLVAELLGDIEIGQLSRLHQIRINLKGKGPKALIVDPTARTDILLDILPQPLEDQMELRFGVQRFHRFMGSGL